MLAFPRLGLTCATPRRPETALSASWRLPSIAALRSRVPCSGRLTRPRSPARAPAARSACPAPRRSTRCSSRSNEAGEGWRDGLQGPVLHALPDRGSDQIAQIIGELLAIAALH